MTSAINADGSSNLARHAKIAGVRRFIYSYPVSFDKIARIVRAFRCRYTVASGASELHDLFERIQMTPERFNFQAFDRLRQLHHLLETGQIDDNFFMRIETAVA